MTKPSPWLFFLLLWSCILAGMTTSMAADHVLVSELTGSYNTLPPPNDQDNPRFGAALALHEDTLVVGAPGANVGGIQNRGVVFVYRLQGRHWQLTQRLNPGAGISAGRCGSAVALSRNFLVIGCPTDRSGTGQGPDAQRGRVVFYQRDTTTGAILPVGQSVVDTSDSPNAQCGTSVSLLSYQDGPFGTHLAAIGCPGRLFGGPGSNVVGGVDIHGYVLTSGFERQVQLAPGALNDPRFGHSLHLLRHGPTTNPQRDVLLVAGLPGTFSNEGRVRIFRMGNTATQWTLEHSYSGSAGSRLGYSVHMRGGRLAMGAPTRLVTVPGTNPPVAAPTGSLVIGTRSCFPSPPACSWGNPVELISSPLPVVATQNRLGQAVHVPTVLRVVAGEPENTFATLQGRVRHYQLDSGTWSLNTGEPFWAPLDWPPTSRKGSALAGNEQWLMVGAPDHPPLESSGRVYVYAYDAALFSDRFEAP